MNRGPSGLARFVASICPLVVVMLFKLLPAGVALAWLAMPCVALALFAVLRRFLANTREETSSAAGLDLDPYEAAYLAGGEKLAVNAGIASLVHRGDLVLDAGERKLQRARQPSTDVHPFEQAILSTFEPPSGQSVGAIRLIASPAVEPIRDRLRELGLVLSHGRARALWGAFWLLLLFNAVWGCTCGLTAMPVAASFEFRRFGEIGPSQLIGCAFVIVLFASGFSVPTLLASELLGSDRSLAGDRMLESMRKERAALIQARGQTGKDTATDDPVMERLLFGRIMQLDDKLAELWGVLEDEPPPDASGSAESSGDGNGFDDD